MAEEPLAGEREMHNVCHLCATVWWEGESGDGWLFMEITRGAGEWESFTESLDAMFCSQAHAAEWLQSPLPEPSPASIGVPYRMTAKERLAGVALATAVGLLFGLAGLGLLTTVRFLLDA